MFCQCCHSSGRTADSLSTALACTRNVDTEYSMAWQLVVIEFIDPLVSFTNEFQRFIFFSSLCYYHFFFSNHRPISQVQSFVLSANPMPPVLAENSRLPFLFAQCFSQPHKHHDLTRFVTLVHDYIAFQLFVFFSCPTSAFPISLQ